MEEGVGVQAHCWPAYAMLKIMVFILQATLLTPDMCNPYRLKVTVPSYKCNSYTYNHDFHNLDRNLWSTSVQIKQSCLDY